MNAMTIHLLIVFVNFVEGLGPRLDWRQSVKQATHALIDCALFEVLSFLAHAVN